MKRDIRTSLIERERMAKESKLTISRDQFKRLTETILKEAPAILDNRDKADKSMDKESTLLKELFSRFNVKLGLPDNYVLCTHP